MVKDFSRLFAEHGIYAAVAVDHRGSFITLLGIIGVHDTSSFFNNVVAVA
ncbi:tagatose-bisphosphate aldolase, partial [Staphylococcus pseudintermedius]